MPQPPLPPGRGTPTVAVIAQGCRANQEEIECILGALRERGFRTVPFGAPADWTILNTCSVTRSGESDARQAIRRARRESGGRVVVTGCFAQRDPAMAARLGADLVVGNAQKWRIPELLAGAADGADACTGILFDPDPTTRRFLGHAREASGYRTRAALKIQDGCDERCTYCIIPLLRGRSVSRAPEEVLAEARVLVDAGHPEITLTGIHSASYGADRDGGVDLSWLLRRLLSVEGLARIRVNSLEPQWVTEELLETLASSPRFCRHLHLPLQSGDGRVLKRMGRGYAPEDYLRVVERARALLPGVAVGADVMVGFPGEDGIAMRNTVALLDAVRPAYLHVFPYSERPGVAAPRLPGTVDEATKRARARQLAARDRVYREAFLRAADGEQHDLILEAKRDSNGRLQALTDTYIRVAVQTARTPGSWVRARLRWMGDARRMLGEIVP